MNILNSLIAAALPITPKFIVRRVADRYIAGTTIADAMKCVGQLNKEGAMATIDVLGEFVTNRDLAERETGQCVAVLGEVHRLGLDSNLSVKLTSLGLAIDKEFCFANLKRIVEYAATLGSFVRVDMENSPYTSDTIELMLRLQSAYPANIGIVLQAYMRRTESDIRHLVKTGTNFRLCKGIYVEAPDVAFQHPQEIRDNYMRCLGLIFDAGSYVGIATHDEALINGAEAMIAERKLQPAQYEFQMLLGVRESKRRQVIAHGHRMRVYVPFGEDWYGYSIRRLKENPSIAGHVFKAMFSKN